MASLWLAGRVLAVSAVVFGVTGWVSPPLRRWAETSHSAAAWHLETLLIGTAVVERTLREAFSAAAEAVAGRARRRRR